MTTVSAWRGCHSLLRCYIVAVRDPRASHQLSDHILIVRFVHAVSADVVLVRSRRDPCSRLPHASTAQISSLIASHGRRRLQLYDTITRCSSPRGLAKVLPNIAPAHAWTSQLPGGCCNTLAWPASLQAPLAHKKRAQRWSEIGFVQEAGRLTFVYLAPFSRRSCPSVRAWPRVARV